MTQTPAVERHPRRGHPVAGSLLAIFGGALWLLPAAVIVFMVPKFVAIFEKFDADVSAVSAAVIAVATAVSAWWPLVGLVWLAVVGGLVAVCVTVRARWPVVLAGVFAGFSFVGVCVAITLPVVALFIPLQRTIQEVGQG
jgi:hypothetical protein